MIASSRSISTQDLDVVGQHGDIVGQVVVCRIEGLRLVAHDDDFATRRRAADQPVVFTGFRAKAMLIVGPRLEKTAPVRFEAWIVWLQEVTPASGRWSACCGRVDSGLRRDTHRAGRDRRLLLGRSDPDRAGLNAQRVRGRNFTHNHDGHFMPGAFLVAGLTTLLAPTHWWPAAVTLVVLATAVALAVWRMIRILSDSDSARSQWAQVLVLAFFLFTPMTVPSYVGGRPVSTLCPCSSRWPG